MSPSRDAKPREIGRWIAFVAWTLTIFTVVPVANVIQERIVRSFGKQSLFVGLLVVLIVGVAAAARWLRAHRSLRNLAWISGIAMVIGGWGWIFRLKAEPAHFVAYGILGVLAFRALAPRLPDQGVYLAAAGLTATVGILDELLQWLVPDRYWDLEDLAINAGVGALIQLLIRKGLEPAGILPDASRRSLRVGTRLLAVAVLLLLLCLSNTPARIAWIAENVPGLDYLGRARGTLMVDYGHLIEDAEIGRFNSRLSVEELARADSERAADVARILDRYRLPRQHGELARLYPSWRDPFVHEVREHLSARNRQRHRAFRADQESEARRLATGSLREARILERYFPRTLEAFGDEVPAADRRRLEELHQPDADYTSMVARNLETRFSEARARLVLLSLLVLLAVADVYLGRTPSGSGRS